MIKDIFQFRKDIQEMMMDWELGSRHLDSIHYAMARKQYEDNITSYDAWIRAKESGQIVHSKDIMLAFLVGRQLGIIEGLHEARR